MAINTIYKYENTGATFAKLKISSEGSVVRGADGNLEFNADAPGSCFGYAYDWARRMLTQTPKLSTPSKAIGTPLQQKVEMRQKRHTRQGKGAQSAWDTAVPEVVRDGGFKVAEQVHKNYAEVANWLSGKAGIYIFEIGFHWLGMGKTASGYYFFDSNYGLVQADSKAEHDHVCSFFHNAYSKNKDGAPRTNYNPEWNLFSIECGA